MVDLGGGWGWGIVTGAGRRFLPPGRIFFPGDQGCSVWDKVAGQPSELSILGVMEQMKLQVGGLKFLPAEPLLTLKIKH